ncbi:MAG: NAD(P)/FAD-dependent oxidoreductase [Acidibacillus sp.]|uniref:NADH dehydrogenase-like protein YjlD n=1 Tax=Sulfoacidibacillus ferrooxidans TaxID=2005001 RepID=A0A9X1V599_9BACL|nr:NAD(P)/FAD-dependent oxidoreductase [Sulfoacidibacillus ferrooxidans]MCI0181906.1 NADH dehydrogenase-like protein YjlD [Sulfoacidibacillus ferrooxidans]MCY0892797.1 NAD(P)/FAD-dependent oxidoreductase [Acidibacillus sp.]
MASIVIVGAGYGGVMAGLQFEKALQPFTLVNKHSYHQFITWLHEAAGGRHQIDDYKVELSEIFRQRLSTIIKDEVVSIDRTQRKVIGKHDEYPYDYAIIGLGSAPEFFGIPGLSQYSMQLRSLETARQIRTHIEQQVKAYRDDRDQSRLRIVVGGAGLTGIEFVGELIDWLPGLCNRLGIPNHLFEVQNVEAAPAILPALSENLQHKAQSVLESKGVRIRTNTKITQVMQDAVYLESGEIVEAKTIVWTGGVRANPLLQDAGFTCDGRGRAKVNEYLQSVDDEHIFIIGDNASFISAGRPLPPTAQLATQMGVTVAQNVLAHSNQTTMKPFEPKILGTLASLGRDVGVGLVGGVQTSGAPAGLAKELTKVKYLWQLGGMRMVSRNRKPLVREY